MLFLFCFCTAPFPLKGCNVSRDCKKAFDCNAVLNCNQLSSPYIRIQFCFTLVQWKPLYTTNLGQHIKQMITLNSCLYSNTYQMETMILITINSWQHLLWSHKAASTISLKCCIICNINGNNIKFWITPITFIFLESKSFEHFFLSPTPN